MFLTILKPLLIIILYFSAIQLTFWFKTQLFPKRRQVKLSKDELTPQQKFSRERKFGLKEFSKKRMLLAIYMASFIIPLGVSYKNYLAGLLFAWLFPWVMVTVTTNLVKRELGDKDRMIQSILDLKKKNMGLCKNESSIYNYQSEFEILEYDKDDGEPSKFRIYLPVTFDPITMTDFLAKFTIAFGTDRGGQQGQTRPFELDMTDEEYPGINMNKKVATIKIEAPLPTRASWEEWYITHPDVQWSFFPLGLGSKGGIPIKNPETGEEIHLIGYDVDGAQKSYCDKHGMTVGADIIASPHSLGAGVTGGGKSVSQNNIINSCLMRPKDWILFGIDMKKVELGKLRRFGVPVATTYKDAADIATYVQKIMLDRFEEMERRNINNWEKMPEDERGPAIMLMVDEVSELMAPTKGKSDEAKQIAEYQDTTRAALESIARLGRAARVVMTIWGQRPDSEVVSMQIRQNCPTRLASGNLPSTISQMVFESSEGARVPGNPKGRMLIKTHSAQPIHFQGFFADSEWITEWLEKNNLPMNVYEGDGEENETLNKFEEHKAENTGDEEFTDYMDDSDFNALEDALK